jgi:hypothetical protein
MRYPVKQLKSLAVGLKELEPHIRNGRALQTHPEFNSIKQRPREMLANWLLCAAGCATRGKETVHLAEDPLGGDGLITESETGEFMLTEHVYARPRQGSSVAELIVEALEHKAKKGEAYARGRTLVVLSGRGRELEADGGGTSDRREACLQGRVGGAP